MMGDLRVLLRYGIVGYLMLFFDIIFVCSYFELNCILELVKDTQLGIFLGIMGIPLGWLCYQLWDQIMNKFITPNSDNIRRIKKWEKEIKDRVQRDALQIDNNLSDNTIKVIQNISLVYLTERDQTGSSTGNLISDPRKDSHSVYSNSQQARAVVGFILPPATYFSYLLIAMYLKFGLSYIFLPMDIILGFYAILLPVLFALISLWGFWRVLKEQQDFAWAILANKEEEIKRLIEDFYRINND